MKINFIVLIVCIIFSYEKGFSEESLQPPDSVQLIAPPNRALDIVASNNFLEWSPSANAVTYRLLLTLDENCTDTVLYDGNLGTTFYILPTLAENTIYYWKVRAENKSGVSQWSELRQFRTAIPDGEALVLNINNADSLVGYVALNTQKKWNGNFLYSKVKSLSKDGSIIFTEKDFPVLFAQDFMVRRIDFIGLDGKTLIGHIFVEYLFSDAYPRTPRKDIIVFFHNKSKIPKEKFPNWKYYDESEIPVTGLIPPKGRLQTVRQKTAEPIVLVLGLGGNNWGKTSEQLFNNSIDAWEFLYPVSLPIDSSASLLSKAIDFISQKYNNKRVGISTHSSGGLVARAMVQQKNYKENVSKLLLLGSPNFGSYLCYKKVYTDELDGIGNSFIQNLEKYSPLFSELVPASSFLFNLNSQFPKKLFPNSEISNTYLAIAGTMPMSLGVLHNEIELEEDGVVSVASAGMLKWDIPLATVSLVHSPINLEDTTKNLLLNSLEIIRGFFIKEYSPTNLTLPLELAVDGFWLRWNYTIKPDSRYIPGKSMFQVSLKDLQENNFTLLTNSSESSITLARKSYFENSKVIRMVSIPKTNNYFSFDEHNNGLGLTFENSPQIVRLADWINVTDFRSQLMERIIPISCTPNSLEFQPLETTMINLNPRSQIMKSWLLGTLRRQEKQLVSDNKSDTVTFVVDTYMDTMIIARFQSVDTLPPLQKTTNTVSSLQNFSLIAPNGVIIDTSISSKATFLPYSKIGYENFKYDNVSYYFMAQPQPGRWKIIQPKSNNTQFVQSYLSDVSIGIILNDSLYKPKDLVPFSVLLPKFFYSKPVLKVRVFSPIDDTVGTEITLKRNDTSQFEYSGVFSPMNNGIYRIVADFSCIFPAGIINRSASKNIEILDALPKIPTLLYPVNNELNSSLYTFLVWQKDSRATSYQVQFSEKLKFTELMIDTVVSDSIFSSLPKLKPITSYYWRVRAYNRRGWTPWSEPFTFHTSNSSLNTPQLNVPNNGTVTIQQNINLVWLQTFRANYYRVQISIDSLFKTPTSVDSSFKTTALQFSMNSNTKYYWRVKAIASDKSESEWSQVWNFKRLLPSPTPILPENKAVNLPLNIRLKWFSPDLSLRFQVEISSKPDFSELVFNQTTLGDTIMYAALPSYFTTFYWRIKWIYSDGSESDWSDVWSFTTILGRPRLDSPGDKVTGVNLNPTLTWNSVPGGIFYHLQLSSDSEFNQMVFEDSLLLVIAKPLKSLQPLTNFYWRVRSKVSSGASEWSDIWSFKTGEEATGMHEEVLNQSIQIIPQPSLGISTIEINLQETSNVSILILDLLGSKIIEIPQTILAFGKHTFPIHLNSKGVYICRVIIGTRIYEKTVMY